MSPLFLNLFSVRYLITYRSFGEPQKRCDRVSQKTGEQLVKLLAAGKHVVINGDFYNRHEIGSVRKIDLNNFPEDFVKQQERAELSNPEELAYLKSINSPQLNGINLLAEGTKKDDEGQASV